MTKATYFEEVRSRFPRVTRRNLGYPWGRIEYPRGWRLRVLPAACHGEDHTSHPRCWEWEGVVASNGGLVILGPQLNDWAWEVLVAFPPSAKEVRGSWRP